MADFMRTWEQYKRKADAVKAKEALKGPAWVTRIERGQPGYKEGFRWAVELDKEAAP